MYFKEHLESGKNARMTYRELIAWQKSMDLTEMIYRVTSSYPRDERYGLTAQIRRAAVSGPSDIAEGQGRKSSDEDFVRFLQIALGSLCEVETQLEISSRLKLLTSDEA